MVDENDFYKKFEVRRTDGEDLPGKNMKIAFIS